jgi:hypothetical protein
VGTEKKRSKAVVDEYDVEWDESKDEKEEVRALEQGRQEWLKERRGR